MKLLFLSTLGAIAVANSHTHSPQHLVVNPPAAQYEGLRTPTSRESTAMARKIMHLTTIGDLITVFPEQDSHGQEVDFQEQRPAEVGGSPIGLLEYYADCDPLSGNPVLLSLNIATPYRNYRQGSNISLSIRWWPKQETSYLFDDDELPTPHTPVALPRFSLHGQLVPISADRLADGNIAKCFMRAHPDSRWWQPGNNIHASEYAELIVDHVYWLGGFGDRALIGWLPIDQWKNLTMEEIMEAKLPGERKAKSWWKQLL